VRARQETKTASIEFSATDRRTKRLVVAEHVAKRFGARRLIDDLSLVLSPGMRLGLLGPNGSGKSTLIRLLTRDLEPDAGRVEHADALRVVTLDQQRSGLDPRTTLRPRARAGGGSSRIRREAGARRRLGASFPVSARGARHAGRRAVRRRAGARPRCRAHATPRRSARARRADERSRHPDARGARGKPRRVSRRGRPRDPRPFPVRARGDDRSRSRRQRSRHPRTRTTGNGSRREGRGRPRAPSLPSRPGERRRRPRAGASPGPSSASGREWKRRSSRRRRRSSLSSARPSDPAIAANAAELAARCRALEDAHHAVEKLYARWTELEAKQG